MMKLACFISVVSLIFSINCFSQEQKIDLNFIVIIDSKLTVAEGIHDGLIYTYDSEKRIQDSIPFQYDVGKLILTQKGHITLKNTNPEASVLISLKYREVCPNVKDYSYSKKIPVSWLFQRYLIFKVYNFDNELNHKNFRERHGYGIDVEIPGTTSVVARKKIPKGQRDCN